MPVYDHTFEQIVAALPALQAGELDELLVRAVHVSRSAVCITDATLDEPGPRIVYVNPSFTRITGYDPEEVIGRTPRLLHGPLTDREVLDHLRTALTAGQAFQGELINYRKDGTSFPMTLRIAPLHDTWGRATHYVATQDDLTLLRETQRDLHDRIDEAQRDAEWLDHLVEISVTLTRVPHADMVLLAAVDAAVDRLGATGATVVMADGERDSLVIAAATGAGQPAAGERYRAEDGTVVAEALSGKMMVVGSSRERRVGAGLGADGVVVTASALGDPRVYGALVLTWEDGRTFRSAELEHLCMLARVIDLTHRRTESADAQRQVAADLQHRLLPVVPELPGLDAAWRYQAATSHTMVGGDWYDAVVLPDGRVALFVGDVSGHSPEAASLMGEVRFTTRGLLRAGVTQPGDLLDQLDGCLLTDHRPGEAMVTMCMLVIDPDGTVHYSSAGHPSPVICRADGSTSVLDGASSRLMGMSTGEPRPTAVAVQGLGDVVVAFSDGAFEDRGQGYDEAYADLVGRLATAERDPVAICERIVGPAEAAVEAESPGRRDDVVALAVRRRPH